MRDEEDDYVLNDEELEAENEDRNLEIDDEDTIASNEEKDEDEEEEEEVDDEEVGDEEEEEEEEDSKDDTSSKLKNETTVIQPSVVKLPPAVTAVPQSVIQKPITTTPLAALEECRPILHQRLLPVENDKQTLPQLSVDPVVVGTLDKQLKRIPHQPKKCPSPNPPVDYAGGGCYPCPPDATKVVSAIPPPPIQPVVYNKQSASVLTSTGGFKSTTTTIPQPPSSFHPTPYRMANKIAPETVSAAVPTLPVYHPPQVQQVYQAPLRTNYSPFPIDYATAGVPLPPPSTAIPIRNVVIAPTPPQETLPMTTLHQNLITTVGGDSEFGGLVSYFSSQQEDDFDT